MEEAFEKLKRDGNNTVNNLVKWLNDSKLIDKKTNKAEEKALQLFEDVKDKGNVEFEKFKEVVAKLAAKQKKTTEESVKMMVDSLPKVQESLSVAAKAFKDNMAKK